MYTCILTSQFARPKRLKQRKKKRIHLCGVLVFVRTAVIAANSQKRKIKMKDRVLARVQKKTMVTWVQRQKESGGLENKNWTS